MKKIGILGGLSPMSTSYFYDLLIKEYDKMFQDQQYPEIIIYSVNFGKVKRYQVKGEEELYLGIMASGIQKLKAAGAHFGIIAANTPHQWFNQLVARSTLPILSIVDHVIEDLHDKKYKKVLLLGTKETMSSSYYSRRIRNEKIEVIKPTREEQQKIDDIIFNEITFHKFSEESEKYLISTIEKYPCDCVILGCTELPMVINDENSPYPTLNTTLVHAKATFRFALKNGVED